MTRLLTLIAATLGLAVLGCAGARIDKAEFSKVQTVVIGCIKAPNTGTGDADAMIFVDWMYSVSPVTKILDGPGMRRSVVAVRYHVTLRLAMVKPDGKKIWLSRAKANFGDSLEQDAPFEFTKLVPDVTANLMADTAEVLNTAE